MARVVREDVQQIFAEELPTDISAQIDLAHLLVQERLGGQGLSESLLKEIERWLAAHFVAVSVKRQAVQEKMGDASVTYSKPDSIDLASTTYGQQVLLLDPTGRLGQLGRRAVVFHAIPATLSEE